VFDALFPSGCQERRVKRCARKGRNRTEIHNWNVMETINCEHKTEMQRSVISISQSAVREKCYIVRKVANSVKNCPTYLRYLLS